MVVWGCDTACRMGVILSGVGTVVVAVVGEGDEGVVELSEAIELVREQLVTAHLNGRRVVAGQVLMFEVGGVSIEFSGEVKKAAGGEGGLKFWVLTAEAKAQRSSTAIHKVRIELIPRTPTGESFRVADGVDAPPTERESPAGR